MRRDAAARGLVTPRSVTSSITAMRRRRRGVVDQVVVTWFAAPHSYTGEDVVEISAHGSPVLLRRIVELGVARGARLAEPGEFTLRALPERPAGSDPGRGRGGSRRCRHAAAGPRGHGSARGHVDDGDRPRSMRGCSTSRRGSKRRSTFPTRDFISSRATRPARARRDARPSLDALVRRAAPAALFAKAAWS